MTQFNSNFTPSLALVDGTVVITGSSQSVPGAELVVRAVGLLQDGACGHTTLLGVGKWEGAAVPGDFVKGPVTAIGTETYFVEGTEDVQPRFVTLSWTQLVEII